MKKVLIATVTTVMALGMAGCAVSQDVAVTKGPDAGTVITDNQPDDMSNVIIPTDSDSLGGDSVKPEESKSEESKSENKGEASLSGTWQTASITTQADGTMAPEFYVQFTDTEIVYGHMKDGVFEKDHADKITLQNKTANGFMIQAESANKTLKYTFKTSDSDPNVLEYFEAWEESAFDSTYSASGSLTKCEM